MLLTGRAHLAGSLYLWQWIPGIVTAAFLIYGSVNLFLATLKIKTSKQTVNQRYKPVFFAISSIFKIFATDMQGINFV